MAQPVQIKAEDARLITRTSAARAGIADLTVKQDFRTDLDQIIRREGYDYFWPNNTGDLVNNPGNQPFPWQTPPPGSDPEQEPITLIHQSRRPNGEHAIIVGTQTKLWRFIGFDEGAYAEGTGANAYFEEAPAANAPYVADGTGEWMLIGSGFSEDGHRWEAEDINGYTIFNNGVDLPVTYRIEETEVVPIYELREQGIASVGTIGETSGILICADISEIHADVLPEVMSPVGDIDGGNMTASQSGSTVTTPADFFESAYAGRTIVWEDGTTAKITAFTDARTVSVDTSATVSSQKFTLRNKATQAGATFSGIAVGHVDASGTTVLADPFFSNGMVGKTIRFSNGFSATITAYTDTRHVTIDTAPTEEIDNLPFWITDASALTFVADSDAFTSDMVGRSIVFDTGETREIVAFVDSKTVTVDLDTAIASEFFTIENTESYSAYTNATNIDRIAYRTIWSMPNEPRRFGVIITGTIEEGSQSLELSFPSKSFEAGDEVIVAGAGVDGGNITATVLIVSNLGKTLLLSETASTDSTDQPVEMSDAFGSIVGFEDLEDDSSGILRVLELGESTVIIYKATSIFIGTFTGSVDNPFVFTRVKIPASVALAYRWSLVNVGGQFHVYAAGNTFYRFDLSARVPRVIEELDLISDKFFPQISLDVTDQVFAADNGITNEVFLFFPSSTTEKALCYDYKYGSASTTGMVMTAAQTVQKPVAGIGYGASVNLFLMGDTNGTLLVYGKANEPQDAWGSVSEIFYRRSAYPFDATKGGYESALESGWGDFGDPYNEKDLSAYVLYLASQSPDCGLSFVLYGTRNPNEEADTLLNEYMQSPKMENLISTFFRANYFRYRIVISGSNNPCRIAAHSFEVDLISSRSHDRRV